MMLVAHASHVLHKHKAETKNSVNFWNLKAHPHVSYKATLTTPAQTVPPNGDQNI